MNLMIPRAANQWNLTVYTSDIQNAGTDAKVFVTLYSQREASDRDGRESSRERRDRDLERDRDRDYDRVKDRDRDQDRDRDRDRDRERDGGRPRMQIVKTDRTPLPATARELQSGGVDKFTLNWSDVGTPLKLRIEHDNSGIAPGWHLDRVVLENSDTRQSFTFNCRRWLARDEEDGAIVRELPAQGIDIRSPIPRKKARIEQVSID